MLQQIIGFMLDMPLILFFAFVCIILCILSWKLNKYTIQKKRYIANIFIIFIFLAVVVKLYIVSIDVKSVIDEVRKVEYGKKESECIVSIFHEKLVNAFEMGTAGAFFIDNKKTGALYRNYILTNVRDRYFDYCKKYAAKYKKPKSSTKKKQKGS